LTPISLWESSFSKCQTTVLTGFQLPFWLALSPNHPISPVKAIFSGCPFATLSNLRWSKQLPSFDSTCLSNFGDEVLSAYLFTARALIRCFQFLQGEIFNDQSCKVLRFSRTAASNSTQCLTAMSN